MPEHAENNATPTVPPGGIQLHPTLIGQTNDGDRVELILTDGQAFVLFVYAGPYGSQLLTYHSDNAAARSFFEQSITEITYDASEHTSAPKRD